jgi:hypothetical protein
VGEVSRSEAVLQACRELGIDADDAYRVEAMLDTDASDDNPCCMSACRPCVLDLQMAARRARRLLERES